MGDLPWPDYIQWNKVFMRDLFLWFVSTRKYPWNIFLRLEPIRKYLQKLILRLVFSRKNLWKLILRFSYKIAKIKSLKISSARSSSTLISSLKVSLHLVGICPKMSAHIVFRPLRHVNWICWFNLEHKSTKQLTYFGWFKCKNQAPMFPLSTCVGVIFI